MFGSGFRNYGRVLFEKQTHTNTSLILDQLTKRPKRV